MKFLCSHCKAKYQISNERVLGRTLRMKCRKCNGDIVIAGDTLLPSDPPPSSTRVSQPKGTPRTAVPATPPKKPPIQSAVKPRADSQIIAARKARAAMNLPLKEQWHAAIDHKPAGPMSVTELKEHMVAGRVTAASLVWRDGFTDWVELKTVKELQALLGPALPQRPITSSHMAANIPLAESPLSSSITDLKRISTLELQAVPQPAAPASKDNPPVQAAVHAAEPASAPERPRAVVESLRPAAEAIASGLLSVKESLRVKKAGLPLGAIVLLVGAGSFGITLAILVFNTWLSPASRSEPSQKAIAEKVTPALPSTKPFKMAEVELDLPDEPTPEPESSAVDQTHAGSAGHRDSTPSASASAPTSTKKLSEQEKALLKSMAEDGSGPTNLRIPTRAGSAGSSKPLNSSQVRAIVTKHRPMLQRCYEQAARASGAQQSIRIDVRLSVSESGAVRSANVDGPNLGNLKPCILNTVKRWRFPASQEATEVPFPLVFQPGA